jgi:Na+-translocating ferredoxin:NAD+ oxidoreductase RNF subunit RnfB
MSKNKKQKPQTIKESQVNEWCETCGNPAYKCKVKCISDSKESETSKTWNSKSNNKF